MHDGRSLTDPLDSGVCLVPNGNRVLLKPSVFGRARGCRLSVCNLQGLSEIGCKMHLRRLYVHMYVRSASPSLRTPGAASRGFGSVDVCPLHRS